CLVFLFLSQANVLILVQDPYNVFDMTDLYLLESQISKAGIGKLVLSVNKFDMLGDVSWEEEIKKREKKKEKIITETDNDIIKDLLTGCEIIPLSSIMALVAHLKSKGANVLSENEQIVFFYMRLCNKFPELQTVEDYFKKSNISQLEKCINTIISEQKNILLDAPLQKLKGLLEKTLRNKKNKIEDIDDTIKILRDGVSNIEQEKQMLNDFIELLNAKSQQSAIQNIILDSIKKSSNQLINRRGEFLDKINEKSYPNPPFFKKQKTKKTNHENIQRLYLDMNDNIRSILDGLSRQINEQVRSELNNIIDYLNDHIPPNMQMIHQRFLKNLKEDLISEIPSGISVSIILSTSIPSNKDLKKQTAVTYYRDLFIKSYSDDTFNGFLGQFSGYAGKVKHQLKNDALRLASEQKRIFKDTQDRNRKNKRINEDEIKKQHLNEEILGMESILIELNSIKAR
ncbi:MAG: hypothetical protein D3910_12510, partial [Candidatus Electrothrix sp. ATG2]|nr:hypothetical protein [Candidatus Electrothrix sp. ATG2]